MTQIERSAEVHVTSENHITLGNLYAFRIIYIIFALKGKVPIITK